jgi:glycosyltransferase involved in cell wall biosynthesis
LIHPRYVPWGIGQVDATCPFPTDTLHFDDQSWNVGEIKARFREAVGKVSPDAVIITDCWNFKPHLADAVRDYPYFLRMQAQECLCPLNNLRLLPVPGGVQQCSNHQFLSAATCRECLRHREKFSGRLHHLDRQLSEVGTDDYTQLLLRTFQEAEGVLALNRSVAEALRPYARNVEVVTWGMDPERFPKPAENRYAHDDGQRVKRIVFAGLADEPIKGFDVLCEACARLWERRHDFELVATAPLNGRSDEFLRMVGWKSQAELPALYASADMTIVPTIAQEGLSRTTVEAMASGCPVIGSRIGGLLDTIEDGINGLFCEPGDVQDLTERIEYLLDRPDLRARFGRAGREKFEREYAWPVVIERQYGSLLARCRLRSRRQRPAASEASGHAVLARGPCISVGSAAVRGDHQNGCDPKIDVQPLKILFLENFSDRKNHNQVHIAETLGELGHIVAKRDEFAVRTPDGLLCELDTGDFDCLLFGKGRIGATTAEQILYSSGDEIASVVRRAGKPCYLWYGDKVLNFEHSREVWMRKVAPLCRVAFVTDGELAKQTWARFRLLRQGVLAQTVEHVHIAEQNKQDLAFIGSIYGARIDELARVRAQYEVAQVSDVFGRKLSHVMAQHRIILGPRYPSAPGYWSDRVYVVLGHGGFFLAPEVPGMREEGLIPGVHYAALGDDPLPDIEYWLSRPVERERIARAGQELAVSRFTYHHRLRELCRIIRETLA